MNLRWNADDLLNDGDKLLAVLEIMRQMKLKAFKSLKCVMLVRSELKLKSGDLLKKERYSWHLYSHIPNFLQSF
jgi:hypothetical protein